jgi:cobalt/nickel transport system permease protein
LPITAFEYCMTLAGPVGVLVAPAAAFQVSFMVTLVLALLGQGGFTVVGLNTLVLALSVRLAPATADGHEMSHTVVGLMRGAGALVVVPMLLLAVAVEALLGAGLGGFLARVRPDLLPRTGEGA